VLSPVRGQPVPSTETEDSLFALFKQFRWLESTEERQKLNADILGYMQSELSAGESFSYSFDSLRKHAGILESGDRKFRIFTWNVPLSIWEHEYHGIIQVCNGDGETCSIFILENDLHNIPDILHARTGREAWPGALYYDLRRNKHGRDVFYTLIGYNFHDRWSDMKIIEVLYFDSEGKPFFGRPVFNTADGIQHRVIFEYSGDVAMNLRYNRDMKMIVYDHLAPIEPELSGHARFYAPDFSYDGYKYRKGRWHHQEDLDVRNR
jgi:hypothetical protein